MSTATISHCGQYRYTLSREGDALAYRNPALFIMLNPSTADAEQDDRTIGRCRAFAKTWGCDGIVVVNLYAYRATKPVELWKVADPVGPDNDQYIIEALATAEIVVCAWGGNARADRVKEVWELIRHHRPFKPLCLGVNSDGSPGHPLYIKGDKPLIPWPGPGAIE